MIWDVNRSVRLPAKRISPRASIVLAVATCSLASCLVTLDGPIYWAPDASHAPLDAQQGADASHDDVAADLAPDHGEVLDASTDVLLADGRVTDAVSIDAGDVGVDASDLDVIGTDVGVDVPADVVIGTDAARDARADAIVPIDSPIMGFDVTFLPDATLDEAILVTDSAIVSDVISTTDARVDAPTDVACTATCGTGTACCAGACVNLSTSEANCGGCGIACPGSQVCQSGACLACPLSLGICLSGGDRCCVIGLCLGLCP